MKMDCVLLSLVVTVGVIMLADSGLCFPGGAPNSTCVDMLPSHGNQSTDPVPYRIYLTDNKHRPVNEYSPGQWIKVTVEVTGNATYRGILMQMLEVGGTDPVGTWMNVANNTRTLSCSSQGDSITHKNTMHKGRSVFTWIAPSQRSSSRRIQVRAILASGYKTWWRNVVSKTIDYSGVSPCCSMSVYAILVAAVLSTILPRLSV